MALVFDIETVGLNFDSLDEPTQKNLTRWLEREVGEDETKFSAKLQDLKEGLGFSPLTGEIVAIGVYDTVADRGAVYFQSPDKKIEEYQQENFTFKPKSEAEMLASFWLGANKYDEFVSFNGRAFDVPFLMIRSAIHKIRPSVDLLANRYLGSQPESAKHIDLFDQLSFYGASRRKGSLHLYCNAFGISSPKARGITGDEVAGLYKDKKYQEIAEYNSWDLIATAELYKIWLEYIKF